MVSLRRCHQVTDVGVASIASAGQLRVLNVNKLHKLGVLAVKALVATCRWVMTLVCCSASHDVLVLEGLLQPC